MANLRFKVKVDHALSNFTNLARAYDMATEESLQFAVDHVQSRIVEIYRESRRGEHPITLAKRASGLDLVDIPSLVEAKEDEKGVLRVGFFEVEHDTMSIIYMQEFGGSIIVTERMRNWYNTMAALSQGWNPQDPYQGDTSETPRFFPQAFPPLKSYTNRFIIPPKQFMRTAFRELGNENILVNRLRFALEAFVQGGRISRGTRLSDSDSTFDDSSGIR